MSKLQSPTETLLDELLNHLQFLLAQGVFLVEFAPHDGELGRLQSLDLAAHLVEWHQRIHSPVREKHALSAATAERSSISFSS